MCSVLAGLTALTGVMQYQGQRQAADAQIASYRAQADQARQNAAIEGKKQEQIADKYAREGEELRQRQRIAAGQTRAQAGAAGLGMAGSPMDILSAGYDAYNQDKEALLYNQRNDNYNRRVTQNNFINQANALNAAADNTAALKKWQGAATILGTAAAVAKTGAFDNIKLSSGSGSSGEWNAGNAPTQPTSWTAGGGYKVQFPYGGPTYKIGNSKLPWLGK